MTIANETGNAPVCNAALTLKEKVYPIKRGNGNSYMNLTSLLNAEGSGIYQKIRSLENEIFSNTDRKISKWRKSGLDIEEVEDYYEWLDNFIADKYKEEFDILMK
jgi:hypothetical protein